MSPIIMWTDKFKLGIEVMDNQNFELITRVNQLISAHNNKENNNTIVELLEFLKDYIITHFGPEEHLQRQYSYPDYNEHRKEHFEFVQIVAELEHKYKKTNLCSIDGACDDLLLDTYTQLTDWLTQHIAESDQDVAKHILRIHKPK